MRRYEILISQVDPQHPNGTPKVVVSGGKTIFNGSFTSTDPNGNTVPGALNVSLDLPTSPYNSPMGGTGAALTVHNVGLSLLQAASQFNPSPDGTSYCNIQISGGMAKGLPLANPKQYGILMKSRIQQALGNWQGTSQTLDLIMVQTAGSLEDPYNFSFVCPNNSLLSTVILSTLQNVFPYVQTVNVNISPNLVAPETLTVQHLTLQDFAAYLNQKSKSILGGTNYAGIQIAYIDNIIYVYDNWLNKNPPKSQIIQIDFNDFIGQPTWINPQTIVFKTVMRNDIKVGSSIQMPPPGKRGLVLTLPASYSQFKNTTVFQGIFTVQTVRHLGDFRSPGAGNWVTVVQAYNLPSQ